MRICFFLLLATIAVIAIIDGSVAVVLGIMAIGLLVLIVPPLVIVYDEHQQRYVPRRPGEH